LSLIFYFGFNATGVKGLIAIPLLFLGATVAAHALARGSYLFGIKLGGGSIRDDFKDQAEVEAKKQENHEVS
jgi:multisubunit Na+/H+ antiporter MnhG subunit